MMVPIKVASLNQVLVFQHAGSHFSKLERCCGDLDLWFLFAFVQFRMRLQENDHVSVSMLKFEPSQSYGA